MHHRPRCSPIPATNQPAALFLDPAVVATERSSTFYKMLEAGLALAHKKHLVNDPRDRIVATAGLPFNTPGCANAIRVIEASGLDCWGGH